MYPTPEEEALAMSLFNAQTPGVGMSGPVGVSPEMVSRAQGLFTPGPAMQPGPNMSVPLGPIERMPGAVSPEEQARAASLFAPNVVRVPEQVIGPEVVQVPEQVIGPSPLAARAASSAPSSTAAGKPPVWAGATEKLLGDYDQLKNLKADELTAMQTYRGLEKDAYDQIKAQIEENAIRERAGAKAAFDEERKYVDTTEKLIADMASQKIDPNQIFTKASDAEKFTMFVGAMAGAISQGLFGGENIAMRMIEQSKRDNIAAQQANLETKRGVIQARNTLFGQLRDAYKDDAAAIAAYGLALTERTQLQLRALLAEKKGTMDEAGIKESIVQTDQVKQKYLTELQARQAAAAKAAQAAAAARTNKLLGQRADLVKDFTGQGFDPLNALRMANSVVGLTNDADVFRTTKSPKGAEKASDNAWKLAESLDRESIVAGKKALQDLKNRIPKSGDIPGLTDFKTNWIVDANSSPLARRVLLSPEERENQRQIRGLISTTLQARSGKAVSEAEVDRFIGEMRGAGTSEELLNFLDQQIDTLNTREAGFRAGAGQRASDTYDANMAAQGQAPVHFTKGIP